MIPELGHFALILACCFAILQSSTCLGAYRHHITWMALARPFARGQFLFLMIAFACLVYAFLSNDFSVKYVAWNSNSLLPWPYQFAAVWGAHEGSLLLWVTTLSIWTLAVCRYSRHLPEDFVAYVIAVLGFISVGFLLFILFTSNPFTRLLPNIPWDGFDLNPLLQDPGLAIHPPMLYMGYVGFAVAFAFAIAALISGKLDARWARWVRPWTITAWCFLTYGITLGSWWAYRVLGWGGWWFWDPVENASLMPWISGTALLHALLLTEKQHSCKQWTVLLAICTFSLSLLGTFLVRSGVLISVHAFATDPARGAFVLKFLAIVIGGAFSLYALRAHSLHTPPRHFLYTSRDTLLLSNNVLLMVLLFTVFLGTLYPLIMDALGFSKLSVGPPYFNTLLLPLATPLLLLMGLAPYSRFQKTLSWKQLHAVGWIFILSVLSIFILPKPALDSLPWWSSLGFGLGVWVVLTTLWDMWIHRARGRWAMWLAHIGIGILAIGITLVCTYQQERDVRMMIGESVILGDYHLTFETVQSLQGPNYIGVVGIFKLENNTRIEAEKRTYIAAQTTLSQAGIHANVWRDIYLALGDELPDGAWTVRLYYKPFVRWIWWGGLMMILGGILGVVKRRHR